MTTPTPSDPPPRSPAGLFDTGMAYLDAAVEESQRSTFNTAHATLSALLAVGHLTAANIAFAFIRERHADQEQRQREVALRPDAAQLRRTALAHGWTEQSCDAARILFAHGDNRLEIAMSDGVPHRAYLNWEPASLDTIDNLLRTT